MRVSVLHALLRACVSQVLHALLHAFHVPACHPPAPLSLQMLASQLTLSSIDRAVNAKRREQDKLRLAAEERRLMFEANRAAKREEIEMERERIEASNLSRGPIDRTSQDRRKQNEVIRDAAEERRLEFEAKRKAEADERDLEKQRVRLLFYDFVPVGLQIRHCSQTAIYQICYVHLIAMFILHPLLFVDT